MLAKVAKPTRHRIQGVNLCNSIREYKDALGLPYSTIADWMGITTSNLTSMISQGLNPYPEQWEAFKAGVKNHHILKQVWINETKTAICAYRKCDESFILWAHNKKYCCPQHGKLERKLNSEGESK